MVCSHCLTLIPIKMGGTDMCRGVHTAQRQTSTQIPIGFCVNLSVSLSVSVSSSENATLQQALQAGPGILICYV